MEVGQVYHGEQINDVVLTNLGLHEGFHDLSNSVGDAAE